MQRGKPLSPFPSAQAVQTINPRVPTQPAPESYRAPIPSESSEEDVLTLAEIAATKPPLKVIREFMRDQLERSEEDEFE